MKNTLMKKIKDAFALKAQITETGSGASDTLKDTGWMPKEDAEGDVDLHYGDFQFSDFAYDPYEESEEVRAAREALTAGLGKRPESYTSPYLTELSSIMDRILNREEFTYDVNADALYQQYKDHYTTLGKTAMRDAMGEAAAMNGGYGSTWAQSVGTQAYQGALSELGNVIPALYEMAYGRYRDEGDALYEAYAMLSDREAASYGQYRDALDDWQKETETLLSRYQEEKSEDYGRYADGRDAAYERYADEKGFAYDAHRNEIEDAQWQKEFEEEKRRYEEERRMEEMRYEDEKKQQDEEYREKIRLELLAERVEGLSPSAILNELKEYRTQQNWEGMDEFLELCVACEKLDRTQAEKYRRRYGKES